jgi:hypothetical protein
MCTKLITFVCVLALATASYADPTDILVGNWENNYDMWRVGWGSVLMGFSGTGATLNDLALNVVLNPGSWGDAIQLKLQGPTGLDLNNYNCQSMLPTLFPGQPPYTGSPWTMFEMDITLVAAEWIDDGDPTTDPYASMKCILNTGGHVDPDGIPGNGDEIWGGVWYDCGDCPSGWDPGQGDATFHCVWDLGPGIQQTVFVESRLYTV